jgi:hypothetical protein
MAQKTSGEFEKDFIEGVEAATGRDLAGWIAAIEGCGTKKRNEMIAWLKTEHGFGHMHAALLAGIHANGGKPVYQSTGALLENQLSRATEMRPLFEALTEFVAANFPEASILPKKTYISVLENREFAAVNIKPAELRIGLDLGERPCLGSVEKARLTGPMPRISHMVIIKEAADLDSELAELLGDSRARCH